MQRLECGYGTSQFLKEDFLEHYLKTSPEFTQRVLQYLLASFLGFTY
jgi:hypothetical protein